MTKNANKVTIYSSSTPMILVCSRADAFLGRGGVLRSTNVRTAEPTVIGDVVPLRLPEEELRVGAQWDEAQPVRQYFVLE
jgi:hypothetical protein